MTTPQLIVTIALMALCVMLTRFLAFMAFPSEKHTPRFVRFLGEWLPSAVFGMLIVYCLKDSSLLFPLQWQHGFDWRMALAVVITILIHLWRKSFFVTIAGGTLAYMLLMRIMAMNVLLIGATGFVGSAILNELVNRGHKVTAVVRNVEKVAKNDLVEAVQADVADVDAIAKLAEGKDAIISAYNPGWMNPDIARLITENYPKILDAAKKSSVERLLIVGGAGTLFCAPGLRVVDSGAIPEEIMGGVRPLGDFYLNTLMNEQDIDWTFFSPAGAFDEKGERTGKFRLGKDDLIVDANGQSHISVQDYAVAMVDELEKPAHHKERFTIGY